VNVLAQGIGIVEPENQKLGQSVLTFFAKVKVTYSIYPVGCRTTPSCMTVLTVHDNVAVAVIVSKI